MESNQIQMFAKTHLLIFIKKMKPHNGIILKLYIDNFILHLERGAGGGLTPQIGGNPLRMLLLVHTISSWISLDNGSSSPTSKAEGSNFNLGFNFLPSSTSTVVTVGVEVEVAAKMKFFSVLASGELITYPVQPIYKFEN